MPRTLSMAPPSAALLVAPAIVAAGAWTTFWWGSVAGIGVSLLLAGLTAFAVSWWFGHRLAIRLSPRKDSLAAFAIGLIAAMVLQCFILAITLPFWMPPFQLVD